MTDERYIQHILAVLAESPKPLTAQDIAKRCRGRSEWCNRNLTPRMVGGLLAQEEKEGRAVRTLDKRIGRNVWRLTA